MSSSSCPHVSRLCIPLFFLKRGYNHKLVRTKDRRPVPSYFMLFYVLMPPVRSCWFLLCVEALTGLLCQERFAASPLNLADNESLELRLVPSELAGV